MTNLNLLPNFIYNLLNLKDPYGFIIKKYRRYIEFTKEYDDYILYFRVVKKHTGLCYTVMEYKNLSVYSHLPSFYSLRGNHRGRIPCQSATAACDYFRANNAHAEFFDNFKKMVRDNDYI